MAAPELKDHAAPREPLTILGSLRATLAEERRANLVAGGVLTVLSILAFANSFANGFAVDDEVIIEKNRLIKSLAYLPTLFATDYWGSFFGSGQGQNLYRPLVMVTFALNYAVGGLHLFGYHLVNLVLHLAATYVLYSLARRLGLSWGAGLAAAALFAVHPLHTEAVTSIVGRTELLMALGVLLAVHWYLRGGAPARLGLRAALASWAAFAVGLLSKEQAVMVPALLVVSDLSVFSAEKGPRSWKEILRGAWGRYGGYLVLLGAYLALRSAVLYSTVFDPSRQMDVLDSPLANVGWEARVLTAVKVAGKYLWLCMWPAKLAMDYSFDAIPIARSILDPWVLLAGLAWGGLLGLGAWAYLRGIRPVFFGVGVTLLTFLPAANLLFPIGTIMGERLFYLPSAGLCLVAGAAWDRIRAWVGQAGRHHLIRRVCLVGVAAVLLLLTVRTILRNRDWRDSETLYQSAVQVVPRNVKILTTHSSFLVNAGRVDEAIARLSEATRIDPNYPRAYLYLGMAYARTQRWELAEAAYRRGLAIRERTLGSGHPFVAETLNSLAVLYYHRGKFDQAEPLHRQALAIREKALGPEHLHVAQSLNNLALVYDDLGRYDQAEPLHRRALAIREKALGREHPLVAESLNNLAVLYQTQGKFDQAEPLHRQALAIRERMLGPSHPHVAQSLAAYADLLRKTNRVAAAEAMEARARAVLTNRRGNPAK